jgi:hypothetical protein
MEKVLRYRAMGSLCRQSAVLNPLNSWKLLGDAERWEHLAEVEIASHFKVCNTTSSSAVKSGGAPDAAAHPAAPRPAAARTGGAG